MIKWAVVVGALLLAGCSGDGGKAPAEVVVSEDSTQVDTVSVPADSSTLEP